MILIDQYMNFITTHEITQEQYLLLYFLKEERGDLIQLYKKHYPQEDGTMIGRPLIKDLVDKGFLLSNNKIFSLSKKILKTFVTPEVAVDEIYDTYPSFIESDKGVPIPLNSMDKRVFKEIYIPKIMGNVAEHKEVIEDIKYAITNNLIRIGINKFLVSEQWKSFRKLRKQEINTTEVQTDDDF